MLKWVSELWSMHILRSRIIIILTTRTSIKNNYMNYLCKNSAKLARGKGI